MPNKTHSLVHSLTLYNSDWLKFSSPTLISDLHYFFIKTLTLSSFIWRPMYLRGGCELQFCNFRFLCFILVDRIDCWKFNDIIKDAKERVGKNTWNQIAKGNSLKGLWSCNLFFCFSCKITFLWFDHCGLFTLHWFFFFKSIFGSDMDFSTYNLISYTAFLTIGTG